MTPGEIYSHGHELAVVLAANHAAFVLAPLVLKRRHRAAHDVAVRAGEFGEAYVLAAQARIETKQDLKFSGYCLCLRDLDACQTAAKRAQDDKLVTKRYAPLSAFEQAMPRMQKNGGRRVGPRLAV